MSTENTAGLRLIVGGDDAGYGYKEAVKNQLEQDPRVASVVDVGVAEDQHTPYPSVAIEAAERIARGEAERLEMGGRHVRRHRRLKRRVLGQGRHGAGQGRTRRRPRALGLGRLLGQGGGGGHAGGAATAGDVAS